MVVQHSVRKRFRVRGTVQGVGFRPFVYALANRLGLSGFVLNDPTGVLIEVEGPKGALVAFREDMVADAPPLAVIERVEEQDVPSDGSTLFQIRASRDAGDHEAAVSADVATCSDCLAEIYDVRARRYRYPFTNCTNCGPRLTIATDMPYDRANTTMSGFTMCSACAGEFRDPMDRRFHAQAIACPECGPRLQLLGAHDAVVQGDLLALTARLLYEGSIVAIKGLGGYHLACSAADEQAVAELRGRKKREEKPFALMVPNIAWARRLADVSRAEEATLASRRRPIVLLRRRRDAPVAPSVAPGNRYLGIMLPYTPLHHLLLNDFRGPLVLTSGNLSDEPIAHRDDEALERLGEIADSFLIHDRPIHVRCDDSVVRVVDERAHIIRRARGYVPEALTVLTTFERPILGAGPELKHTFCLGDGDHAIVSHHIGDLENYDAMAAFLEGVSHYKRLFEIEPEVVAHDLHPEYLSTKWAMELDIDKIGVQHHHAHVASCLADNGRADKVIGLALDGTGWGEDGSVWGCEVLACDLADYERVAHLRNVAMPGGTMAVREPWRMAASYLDAAMGEDADRLGLGLIARSRERWAAVVQMARAGINSPMTSSAGRLFDAVAALCGVRERVSYEGQAAAELEQLADASVDWGYPCPVSSGEIDGVELVAAVAEDLAQGRPVPVVAAAFHNGLAAALTTVCKLVRRDLDLDAVALSGGTWQNLRLLQRVRKQLIEADFDVLVHHRVPPNDGGISLGQAVVANARVTA
jgi:hydrogenase maturation protein HypF